MRQSQTQTRLAVAVAAAVADCVAVGVGVVVAVAVGVGVGAERVNWIVRKKRTVHTIRATLLYNNYIWFGFMTSALATLYAPPPPHAQLPAWHPRIAPGNVCLSHKFHDQRGVPALSAPSRAPEGARHSLILDSRLANCVSWISSWVLLWVFIHWTLTRRGFP